MSTEARRNEQAQDHGTWPLGFVLLNASLKSRLAIVAALLLLLTSLVLLGTTAGGFRTSVSRALSHCRFTPHDPPFYYPRQPDANDTPAYSELFVGVCINGGTESPVNKFIERKNVTYTCACCGEPLFAAEAKFDSRTGWPSFWAPVFHGAVDYSRDVPSLGTEVHCSTCGAHLGHVFTDGPSPTGLRYCIDGVCLREAPNLVPFKDDAGSAEPRVLPYPIPLLAALCIVGLSLVSLLAFASRFCRLASADAKVSHIADS
jgi:peptide-methionine (R)-S-oxide reductase